MLTEDLVHPITSFSASQDGAAIAASCLDGIIRLWNSGSSASRQSARGSRVLGKLHSNHKCNDYKVECSFASSDEYVVSGSECGAVAVYPVDLGGDGDDAKAYWREPVVLRKHKGPTCSVAACPSPSRPWLVVSASYDGSATVWASDANHDCLAG